MGGVTAMARKKEQPPMEANVTMMRVSYSEAMFDPELRHFVEAQLKFCQDLCQWDGDVEAV
jgi:hypothetical protein